MAAEMSVAEWVEWQKTAFTGRRRFLRDVFFQQFLAHLLWKVTVEGLEYVPASGPAMIMMSHSTLVDITLPLGVIKNRFVVAMSKQENFELPLLSWVVRSWGAIPVRRGEVDRRALEITLELLRAGELVLIMPEGTRTPALREAKDGLAYLALKADALIVPTAVWGLEHYVQDALHLTRPDAHIRFGPPFRLKQQGEKRVPRDALAQMTREMMYQLARLYPEHKRGHYADLSQATTGHLIFA